MKIVHIIIYFMFHLKTIFVYMLLKELWKSEYESNQMFSSELLLNGPIFVSDILFLAYDIEWIMHTVV